MAVVRFVGWIQSFSDLGAGMSRGPLPWAAAAGMMGVAMVAKDEDFAVMLIVQCVVFFEAQRIVQPDGRSGHSSSARVGREQLGSSGRVEVLENSRVRRKRSVGRSSFGRTRQSIDEIHSWESSGDTPLEQISGKVRRRFFQMGRGRERDRDPSSLGSSRRSVVSGEPDR